MGWKKRFLALYACGMSQQDIAEQIKELYDVEISPELVTKITEKMMPEVTAWQNRPLEAVYPQSRLQRCIIHQIRSSTRFVSYKDIKQVVAGLKKIYTAVTLEEAEDALRQFGETWRKQYPSCVKSWEENWDVL